MKLMNSFSRTAIMTAFCIGLAIPMATQAQNIAIVNGKPVPKNRADILLEQFKKSGQPTPPDLEKKINDEVVLREILMQEAENKGIQNTPDFSQQMELARQSSLIRELLNQYQKTNPVTDAEVKAEYDKVKGENSGKEYHARHILVDKEDQAKTLIAKIKKGAKFEELAKKNSKDPGSGKNGGDLDWAAPSSYVPEFSQAMTKLQKGEMTETPVKSQFGWHIIKLEDVREASFPPLEQVKPQIEQQLKEKKLLAYREELKNKAKTDYSFAPPAAASN
jgi:peptidyl-prolyl cis-trans isomerase C